MGGTSPAGEHGVTLTQRTPARERLAYLDWLRVVALVGVFLYHCLQPFSTDDWYVKNAELSEAITIPISFFGTWGIGFFFLIVPRPLLAIFGMDDPAVVEIGVQLLRVLSVSGLLIAVALTYTGGLQGTGDTRSPLYISIVSQLLVPLGICFVLQRAGTLDAIDIWLAIFAGHATRCLLSVVRFNQGKWRTIAVSIDAVSHKPCCASSATAGKPSRPTSSATIG